MWWFLPACGPTIENRIVEAPELPQERSRETGRVWLLDWPPVAESLEEAAFAALQGPSGSRTGAFLQAVDLDRDGSEELLVGSPAEVVEEEAAGRARILRGVGRWRGGIPLAGEGAAVEARPGESINALRAVGDQTGDGIAELVLAVRSEVGGAAYLLDGSEAVEGAALGPADALASVVSPDAEFGRTLAAAGDLDGDGGEDLVLNHDPPDAGRQLIVWRSGDWLPGQAASVVEPPAILLGPSIRNLELWQAPAGDLNGDTVPELVIPQAQVAIDGMDEVGTVAVFDGASAGTDGFRGDLEGSSSRLEGSVAGQRFGTQATGLGDLDGDGASELAVVSRIGSDPEAWATLVFSGAGLASPGVRGQQDALASLPGHHAVFPAPDLDRDGSPEVVVLGDSEVVVLSGAALPASLPLARLDTGSVAPTWWTTRVVVLRDEDRFVLAVGLPDDDLSAGPPED